VKITHHLDDATILAHAAGTLPQAHAIVAMVHMMTCQLCRNSLRSAETIGANLLAEGGETTVSDTCRTATLASLDNVAPAQKPVSVRTGNGLPQIVSKAIGGVSLDNIKWKKKAPGIGMVEIPLLQSARSSLKLFHVGPGCAIPEHGHGGTELTLVLQGSYRDHIGQFCAGDVADLDATTEHQPVVDSSAACICLVATEAPTRFRAIWARILQPFIGI
jgi:putative transcriptional regulator